MTALLLQSKRYGYVLLLWAALLSSVTAHAQATNTLLHLTKGTQKVTSIFKSVKEQTGYVFFYSSSLVSDKDTYEITKAELSLTDLLNGLTTAKGWTYTFSGKQIILQKKIAAGNAKTASAATATYKTITGKVTNITGDGIAGASIQVKGSNSQTTTTENGSFTLSNLSEGSVLVVSHVGFETRELNVNKSDLMIALKAASKELEEVVVTALGINREQKSLGYATQKIDGSAVSDAPTNGFVNALSGKVAGLNLTKAGGPMGSSKVVLRGENVLNMQADGALIVVDGIPVNTSFTGTSHSSYLSGDSPIDFGSALTDINPEDIESINVLKGPAAAALYGSRAMNGAIIITTKNGSKNKNGIGVTFSTTVALDEINHWPDYQYEYGQGLNNAQYYSYGNTVDGTSTSSTSSAWGPRFNGQSFFQYNSPTDPVTGARTERTPWQPYYDNRKDFFRTGFTLTNSVSIGSSSNKGDARLSFTRMKNDWIMPNTAYERYTVAFSGTTKVNDKLTLATKINYTNKSADNLPNVGYNNQSIAYFIIFQNPNVNLDWYQPYWKPGQEGIAQVHPFSSLIDNPYLIVNEMINASNRHNITGNVNATYKFNKKWELMLRTGIDIGYEFRNQRRPKNTQKFQDGMYRQQTVFNAENNSDFLLKYRTQVRNLVITANVGGNIRQQQRYYTDQRADRLSAPNEYNLANSNGAVVSRSDRAASKVNSAYGFVNLAWKNRLFADITGRNDWSSTLSPKNRSFFYPSIAISASLTEMLQLPTVIDNARVRFSFASVGHDATSGTYSLEKYFIAGELNGTATNPDVIPNENLKPERVNAFELGTQWAFFKNRLNIDVTTYYQNTIDQILRAPIDPSTGYRYQLMNVGSVINKGIEVVIKGTPIQTKSFSWQTTVNWAMNRSLVKKLNNIGGSMILATGARGTLEAHEGRPMGDIYGIGYLRAPDGQVVFENGLAKATDSTIFLGNTAPDWRGGVNNQFTYKHFTFSFLFDFRMGGVMYSLSHAAMAEQGKLKKTLPGREGGIIGNGVMLKDGKYVTNDVIASNISSYYNSIYNRDIVEGNLFDASYAKLREVNLQYTFNSRWLQRKTKFIQGATIGIYGRDLFIWTKFPVFDPETATLDNNTIIPGFETGQFPSTRSYGINFKLNF